MRRRHFILGLSAVAAMPFVYNRLLPWNRAAEGVKQSGGDGVRRIRKSADEWRKVLTHQEFHVLRQGGTEAPFSSPLNNEHRVGTFVCAACALPLFKSQWKFNSGTGWPSFYTVIHEHIATKRDFKLILPRTEYHCARCGGHQGHIFHDGPKPTGERWCNDGIALNFIPA